MTNSEPPNCFILFAQAWLEFRLAELRATAEALAEYISVSPALKSLKYACLPAQYVILL